MYNNTTPNPCCVFGVVLCCGKWFVVVSNRVSNTHNTTPAQVYHADTGKHRVTVETQWRQRVTVETQGYYGDTGLPWRHSEDTGLPWRHSGDTGRHSITVETQGYRGDTGLPWRHRVTSARGGQREEIKEEELYLRAVERWNREDTI